jgi:hypothetical protein
MKKIVPKKYHEILTPDYGVGCKRRIFDATCKNFLSTQAISQFTITFCIE